MNTSSSKTQLGQHRTTTRQSKSGHSSLVYPRRQSWQPATGRARLRSDHVLPRETEIVRHSCQQFYRVIDFPAFVVWTHSEKVKKDFSWPESGKTNGQQHLTNIRWHLQLLQVFEMQSCTWHSNTTMFASLRKCPVLFQRIISTVNRDDEHTAIETAY